MYTFHIGLFVKHQETLLSGNTGLVQTQTGPRIINPVKFIAASGKLIFNHLSPDRAWKQI